MWPGVGVNVYLFGRKCVFVCMCVCACVFACVSVCRCVYVFAFVCT